MSIVLSDEQKIYVQTSGKVILNACPGSGKTTTVAHKLFSLTQNWENNFSPSAGIVCISFTNVAKNEIAEKYKCTIAQIKTWNSKKSTKINTGEKLKINT